MSSARSRGTGALLAVLVPLALLAGACADQAGITVAAPGTCHARGAGLEVLPDPVCTPGETNADVTQVLKKPLGSGLGSGKKGTASHLSFPASLMSEQS
jgi:hypothetical protein